MCYFFAWENIAIMNIILIDEFVKSLYKSSLQAKYETSLFQIIIILGLISLNFHSLKILPLMKNKSIQVVSYNL